MNNIIIIGGEIIKGDDYNMLLAEADQRLAEIQVNELNRAYGYGGWR